MLFHRRFGHRRFGARLLALVPALLAAVPAFVPAARADAPDRPRSPAVLMTPTAPAAVRAGDLRGLEGHGATGRLSVRRVGNDLVVSFPADFRVTDTNKVLVGFGRQGRPIRQSIVTPLPALSGAQEVTLPGGGADPSVDAIWLYCDQHQGDAGVARLR
jgi:hypothetical protein